MLASVFPPLLRMDPSTASSAPSPPRWRLLGLMLITALAALAVIWWGPQMSRQHRSLRTMTTLGCLLVSSLVWLLAFSRLPWRTRRRVLLSVFLVVAALVTGIRMRGFSGDMVPIFELRWAGRSGVSGREKITAATPASPMAGQADYAQFLGPERQARIAGPVLMRDWKSQQPELVWRHAVGPAWSAFAIAGRHAVTQEQRGANECVVCYDLFTGAELWEQLAVAHYISGVAGDGPRATPTIEGERCYTQGATGRLQCLDLATGAVIWSADTVEAGSVEGSAKALEWGISSSPCIDGPLVLAAGPEGGAQAVAASLIAFDKTTGAVRWKSGRSGGAYSSPIVSPLGGVRQVVYFGFNDIAGYEPGNGSILWSHPWPSEHVHVCMPLMLGEDDVLVSSGYGRGSARLHISKSAEGTWTATEVWRTNKMKAKFTNLVLAGDFVYGLDDGVLACLDARDGKLRWRDGKYRHGQVILVGALLLLMAEDGDVVLVDPQPNARHELCRFSAISGRTWNPPALAGRYLVVRNDIEAACYRLPIVASERK